MSILEALGFMAVWFIASIPVALVWGRLMRRVSGDYTDAE